MSYKLYYYELLNSSCLQKKTSPAITWVRQGDETLRVKMYLVASTKQNTRVKNLYMYIILTYC